MAGPDVRVGEAIPDGAATEADSPREVRWEAVAAVQGPGSGVPTGTGAETVRSEACCGEDKAEASEVRSATDPPLAAYGLRERTTLMRLTLLRTGHFHFAKNRTLSLCVYNT